MRYLKLYEEFFIKESNYRVIDSEKDPRDVVTYPMVLSGPDEPAVFYIRDKNNAFYFDFNPVSKPKRGEEHWPIETIFKIEGVENILSFLGHLINPKSNPDYEGFDDDEIPLSMEAHTHPEMEAEKYEMYIEKYGENYDRNRDYNKMFKK